MLAKERAGRCGALRTFALLTGGTLCCYVLFFHQLAARDLWSSHEARAAQNAQTMLDTGDWVLPRLYDGRAELQKPPLYYWLVAGIARARGGVVDAWAVRLPAAASALGCVLLLWFAGWRAGMPLAGLLAAVCLATLLRFTWLARVGRIDMPLTFAVSLALVAFCFGYQAIRNHAPSGRATRRPETAWSAIGWLGLFYAAMAAAVLLKGPIGLALPLLAVMTFLVVQGEPVFPWHGRRWLKLMHELGVWWGVLLFLALVLPWFVLAQQATDGTFFREFFIRHNLQRGLGGDELLEAHDSSLAFGYYVIRLAYDAAPWSWLLPVAGFLLWKRHWLRDEPVARFACAWFVSMLVFFSLMRYKRPDYLLPALPGLALLLGVAAERCWRAAGRRMRLALACGGSVAVLAVVAGWLVYAQFVLPRAEPAREQRSFAAAVRRHAGPDSPIVLFRTEPHALMFHVGRPITRIMEWENLDVWAAQPAAFYVVMPAKWADERLIEQHLEAGRLYCVTSNSLLAGMEHEEPLVLFCTRPIE